jgi:gamma-glutamylcyclotransferase (GGCT)/AIG2-like uncharacterized protein YtfP
MATDRLFAYGTLRDPEVLTAVLGRLPELGPPGRLPGHVALTVVGQCYPVLVPRAGTATPGTLISGLSPADWQQLDRYEGPGYRRQSVRVAADGGIVAAQAYFALRGLKAGPIPWDIDGWTRRHKQDFLRQFGR